MKDSSLIMPDAELIKKFTEEKKKVQVSPDKPISVDGHVDLPYFMMSRGLDKPLSELTDGPLTLKSFMSANMRLFCTAIFCEDSYNGPGSEARYQEVLDYTVSRLDTINLINEKEDLALLEGDPDRVCTILLLENADFLADDPAENVPRLRQDGIRIVGLTHFSKNRLADGNGVTFSDGITDVGKQAIDILLENHFIIDTAHLHPKAFWQLMDLTENGVICSHTGIQEIFKIPRNLDLKQVREIVERGGIIGITLNPEMLSPDEKVGLGTVFAHLDTVVQRFGPDVVGIGSDLGGFDKSPPELSGPEAFERLKDILLSHGYDDDSIQAIIGLNWLRFFRENL
ncbi:MAG: hypothetical protein DRH12_05085 [Deltaproteobacteria bacterium]|nr:MAG: hypothetical protein DRH12_05085 [Deltaproteobacteria bacterium]